MRMSLPFRPIVVMVSRLTRAVRSGLIAIHESPRSVDLNSLLAATSNAPVSVEWIIGESQKKR